MTKGFYDHLHQVPNPHPERKTKGTLKEFDRNARLLANEALRRTGVENVEYDVRPETKHSLGRNSIRRPKEDDGKKEKS